MSYDPGLPFLAELEAEITRAAEERLAVPAAPPTRAPAPSTPAASEYRAARRSSWRPLARIPRRAAVLALLVCLVGAMAPAAVRIFDGGNGRAGTSERAIVDRSARPEPRELTLHVQRGELCPTLVLPGTVDTSCVPVPPANGGIARSAVSPFTRYVYGIVGTDVDAVEVRVGARTQRAATRPLPAAAARLEGARDLRWYLVTLDRPGGRSDPIAFVRLYTREQGRPGARLVDCSLGQIDERCPAR
jgi:hypothetical protein